MENGRITSAQLTASSQWDGNHSPNRARLNIPATGNYRGAWAVAPDQINQNQWIQVDLRIKTRITYVATQGRADAVQWLKKYRLQFGDDGSSFEGFKQDGERVDKVGLSCDKRGKRVRKSIPRYVLWLAPLKVFGGKLKMQGINIEMTFSALSFSEADIFITNLPPIFSLIMVRHPITKDLHLLLLPNFSEKTERDCMQCTSQIIRNFYL